MKLKHLLLLSLPIFALSITSCGKGNGGGDDDGGGGGEAAKGKTLSTGVIIETALDQEMYNYFKALTGRDPEKKEWGGDVYGDGYGHIQINFKKKYSSHEALLKDAMKCIDDTKYDIDGYKESGMAYFDDVSGKGAGYSDRFTKTIYTKMDGSYTGKKERFSLGSTHIMTESDQDLAKSYKTVDGKLTTVYPDIGDFIYRVDFSYLS